MKTYIALLRGINVSGKNTIKMDALKEMFLDLGFIEIQTYIQSGNVIFSESKNSSKSDLSKRISNKIKESFSLDVPVLILKNDDLKTIIELLPFSNFEEKNIYITYLSEALKMIDYSKVLEKKSNSEEIHFTTNAIFLNCPNGYGDTKLSNNFLEKQFGIICTTRNLKTSKKILFLSSDM